MKKILFLCFVAVCFTVTSYAQTSDKSKVETTTKVKKKKTIGNRVHNTFHPRRKHYSGVKVKKEVKKTDN